jgi:signal transduction histidine kinase
MEDAGDRLKDCELDLLQRQAKNAKRLGTIVDDMLEFARLSDSELRKVDFDMSGLAKATAAQVAERWARPAGKVSVQEGMRAVGDSNLIGYALANLLDNAFKFSPEGGPIDVGFDGTAFFVRDQGVGFDMTHAHKLFVAFERLVGQETFEGTGVGLANVKRIIERHGGSVWADSAPNQGSTFFFELPH